MGKTLEIIVAKRAGFCFGVKRAVDIAFGCAETGRGAFSLGPIIHNPQVVERLALRGVLPIEEADLSGITPDDTIIIRTHGIPAGTSEMIKDTGCKVIDATCPFVKKAQQYTKLLSKEGYQVLIIGDSEHPEVKGLMSYAGDEAVVLNSEDAVKNLRKKVGIVVQTTQPEDLLKRVVQRALDKVKELKIYNTICSSTGLRLKETVALAGKVDAMFVVGGKNSANTTQLTKLCLSKGIKTFHVETASEIKNDWLKDISMAGVTAGASTPDWLIEEVTKRIKHRGGKG